MKLSYRWLNELVPIGDVEPEEVGLRLTMATAEIEGVEPVEGIPDGVVVGRILEVEPHRESDHLYVTRVDVGSGTLQVISGAPNTRAGTHVPVALEGTVLAGGTVSRTKIRGVESRGVVCSEMELGVSDDHSGLWVLDRETGPDRLSPGVPCGRLFETSDFIFDIDNKAITNRPDLWSHYGFARELAAIFDRELRPVCADRHIQRLLKAEGPEEVNVEVADPDLCSRYSAVRLEGIRVARSPFHLRRRLSVLGVRPINNIVDATNWAMLLTGQPLHAFDARKVSGHIVVRRAAEQEEVVTLDGQARRMPPGALLIADPAKPIGIAGIMGGSNSEIDEGTTSIIIESANFNAVNIRRTALRLGLRTEASNRFEKSLDPALTIAGLACCVSLIDDLVEGASTASPLTDVYPGPGRRPVIELDTRWVAGLIGAPVDRERIRGILASLQFEVRDAGEETLRITVPSFRAQKDVTIKQDLVEEIGRIYGYNNVTAADPVITSTTPMRDELLVFLRELRRILSGAAALTEVYTYSFQEDGILDLFHPGAGSAASGGGPGSAAGGPDGASGSAGFVLLRNPVSSTLSRLRRSLIPGLYSLIEKNAVQRDRVGMYEIGTTFHPLPADQGLPEQRQAVAALLLEPAGPRSVFYSLKGKLEVLLDKLDLADARFTPVPDDREAAHSFNQGGLGDLSGLHPGRAALVSAGGDVLGVLAELHPRLLKQAGVDFHHLRAAVFELDAALLHEAAAGRAAAKRFTPVPRYPEVTMAIAVVVDEQVQAQEVREFIEAYPSDLISRVRLFDIYRGKPLAGGKKSLAFEIRYRGHDRTLTDQEAKNVHEGIAARMKERGWELR